MFPTLDDSAYIYARACEAWYGAEAVEVASGKLAQVKASGDTSGIVIWERICREIETRSGGSSTPKPH